MLISVSLALDALNLGMVVLVLYGRWQQTKDSMVEMDGMKEYDKALVSFIKVLFTTNQDSPIKLKYSIFLEAPSQLAQTWKKTRLVQLLQVEAQGPTAYEHSMSNDSILVDQLVKAIVSVSSQQKIKKRRRTRK